MDWVLIPTKRPNAQLARLCQVVGESGWRSVVLVYAEHYDEAPDAHTVMLKRGKSFNAWVNAALDWISSQDGDARVVIMNDDIDIPHGALEPLFRGLDDAEIAYMGGRGEMFTPAPLEPHMFAVRAATVRLPDPDGLALWWWNTDHLWHEFREAGRRMAVVPVLPYSHQSPNGRGGQWHYPSEFEWSVQGDHDWFWAQWWHLDPSHSGCYLNWWPSAIPDGQEHITDWPREKGGLP